MTQPLEIVLILRKASTSSTLSLSSEPRHSHELLDLCPLRKKMLGWLYRAQRALKTNRSTLFLAISLLDRLIIRNFRIREDSFEFICGILMIISAKFNEIYPPSLRKVRSLVKDGLDHSSEEFINLEATILGQLDYNIVDQFELYSSLAEVQYQSAAQSAHSAQQIIETALNSPQLFRYGGEVLRKAAQYMIKGTRIRFEDEIREAARREINQISSELSQEYEFHCRLVTVSNN